MVFFRQYYPGILRFLKIAFIIVWLSNLALTDAYISVYAIIAFVSFYSVIQKREYILSKREHILLFAASFIFSIFTLRKTAQRFNQTERSK